VLLEVSDGGVDTMQRLKQIMGWMSFVIFLIAGWGQLLYNGSVDLLGTA